MEEKSKDYYKIKQLPNNERVGKLNTLTKGELINKIIELEDSLAETSHRPTKVYKGGVNAGDIAIKYRTPVGELGCPHCGIVVNGAIFKNNCGFCGKDYFKFNKLTEEELSDVAQEYGIGEAENDNNLGKEKINVAIEGFIAGYKFNNY